LSTNQERDLREIVIPLPQEREYRAILGSDGEVCAYVNPKKKDTFGRDGYFVTFQQGLRFLAEKDLTGEQSRVLFYLLSELDFDNYLRISQAEIARELGMNQPHVSRAIKRLLDLDIISKGPLAGRSNTYILNPRIAHKGAKNYRKTVADWDEVSALRRKKAREQQID
jgi:DNA-binding transcriptional ArsR family regulator